MRLFPPSPEPRDNALAYVEKLRGNSECSEFQAGRSAVVRRFQSAWMLMILSILPLRCDNLWFYAAVLVFAVWAYVSGIRMERLLDLFEPRKIKYETDA